MLHCICALAHLVLDIALFIAPPSSNSPVLSLDQPSIVPDGWSARRRKKRYSFRGHEMGDSDMWQIDLTVCHKLERSGADDGMEPLTHEEVQIMLDGRFSLELLFDGFD